MDWKRTELIFIIAFLILDIFLAVVFFNKQMTNDPDKLGSDTLQEHLKTDNITYPKLSTKAEEGEIYTAEQLTFTPKDLPSYSNQSFKLQNIGKEIFSEIKKPFKAYKQGKTTQEMVNFLKENVYKGSIYTFWRHDKETNELIFNQVMEGSPVLFDSGGQIKFKLNENGEVVSYRQTMLKKQDDLKEKDDLLSAFDALEAIYQHGDLHTDSKIEEATFGYYTTVQLSSGDVYFPVWCFEVKHKNKTTYFLVNAKDEQVINTSENRTTDKTTLGKAASSH